MTERRTKAELAEACHDAATKLTQLTQRVRDQTAEIERLQIELDQAVESCIAQDQERRTMERHHSDELGEIRQMFAVLLERLPPK